MVELVFLLEWVLRDNKSEKMDAYYVYSLMSERMILLGQFEENKEYRRFKVVHNVFPFSYDSDLIKQQLKQIEDVLANGRFAAVVSRYECVKGDKWYRIFGVSNLREIFCVLGREAEYIVMYKFLSNDVHGSRYNGSVYFYEGKGHVIPLRGIEDMPVVLDMVLTLLLRIYDSVLREYRAEELPLFWKKYKEQWRERFMRIPNDTKVS